ISNAGTVSDGGAAVFTVTMSGSISAPTTVWYSTINGTASSTAGDFTALTGQALTFNPGGPTTQQITVPILVEPGNPAEGVESFSVGLQATQSGAAYATGSATILANGTVPTFSISGPGTVSEGANALFTVTMTGAISAPTTVWYSTIDGTATAAAGDFSAVNSQAVTFNPGGPTTQQISIPILVEAGNPAENAENFSVGLQASQGGAVFTSSSATIAANGSTAGPTFSISNAGTVSEGGAAVFTVTMSGSISAPTTVWYSTVNGTATAAAGDFNAVSSQALTFNPGGPTSQQISVPILVEPNNPAESAESFSVGLQATQGGAVFTSGSATIAANGGTTNAPTFTISNAGTVTEGGAAVFTVTMSGSISAPTTIWYSTINGTASSTAGDFSAVANQALTFNPGGPTTQQISIPILIEPSNPPENNEIFYVGLKATQTGAYFAHGSATIAANGSSGASAALFMSSAEGLDAPSVDAAKAQDWAAALESLNLLDNSQHIAALAHAWSAGVAGELAELAPHGATTLFEGAAPFVPALIASVSAAAETPWSGEPEHLGPQHAHFGDGFALQLGLQVHHGDWFG
ncbi:MAG TPA: Calx-beta domain-containing protein, partial [Caulobacteraceae bacterium]|nr:Calx-beta domain-containing protein [Caulobacteraceae bacterium]